MSMESAVSVLCDPAVLGLEAALFTAWALAEIHMQRTANTAKEIIDNKTKELWSASSATNIQPYAQNGAPNGGMPPAAVPAGAPRTSQDMGTFLSMASNFESLSLENMYGSFSLPRVTLPQLPAFPNMPNLPAFPNLSALPNFPFPRGVRLSPFSRDPAAAEGESTASAEHISENGDGSVKRTMDDPVLTGHSPKMLRMDSADSAANDLLSEQFAADAADFLNLGPEVEAFSPSGLHTTPATPCPLPEAQQLQSTGFHMPVVPEAFEGYGPAGPYAGLQKHDEQLARQLMQDEMREAEERKEKAEDNAKQKRRPRTKEQLERCRQESARARERKKVEKMRLERVVAARVDEAQRLRARMSALMAEVQAMRDAVLRAAMHTVSQIPNLADPARARQALATVQLCAEALQAPSALAYNAMSRFTPSVPSLPTLAPKPSFREIRPRLSVDSQAAVMAGGAPSPTPSLPAVATETNLSTVAGASV